MKGKNAVVVGRSNIVGLPVSLLLLKADATVTIVHSRSSEPEKAIREADIVIAAAGQPMMVIYRIRDVCSLLAILNCYVYYILITFSHLLLV